MGARLRRWGSIIVLTTLWSTAGSMALADEQDADLPPLAESKATDVLSENGGFNSFFSENFTGGDAKFFFNIDPDDKRLYKDTQRIEAFYFDYLKQLGEEKPDVRTRDLPNPYNTSIKELNELK